MLVTIRLFARLREIAGAPELTRELPDAATARTAWDALTAEFHALREHGSSVSVAVNEEYAGFATTLRDGDEVAFLPPVSGGGDPATIAARTKRSEQRSASVAE